MARDRNLEILTRGNNVFIGELAGGAHLVLFKQDTSVLPVVVMSVKVPMVGLQSYFVVPSLSLINQRGIQTVVEEVMHSVKITIGNTVNITEESSVDPFDKRVIKDFNTEWDNSGHSNMDEATVLKALADLGYTVDFTFTTIKVDSSVKTGSNKFDPALTVITPELADGMKQNKIEYRFIEYSHMPALTNTYQAVLSGKIKTVLWVGESGTGKTSVFHKMAADAGAVAMSFNAATNVDEDFVFGSERLNTGESTEDKRAFRWLDGLFTKAYEKGYWLLIDEINMIQDGGVLGPLNNSIASPYKLELANGKTVKMHPNFRLFVAMNVGYNHTFELNQALANRFQRKVRFPDVTEAETISRLHTKYGFKNTRAIKKLYGIYESLRAIARKDGIDNVISYRNIEDCIVQAGDSGDIRDALEHTLIESIFYETTDPTLLDSARDVLKKDINDLEKLFTGIVGKGLEDINSFDFGTSDTEAVDDADDILAALDEL